MTHVGAGAFQLGIEYEGHFTGTHGCQQPIVATENRPRAVPQELNCYGPLWLVWVYDTLKHQIGVLSQQQGAGSSITFSSQFGTVELTNLPVVSRDGQPVQPPPAPSSPPQNAPATQSPVVSSGNAPAGADVLNALERLGELLEKGVVSDEEFNAKKADLLSRL
jgi:hypothetical protein